MLPLQYISSTKFSLGKGTQLGDTDKDAKYELPPIAPSLFITRLVPVTTSNYILILQTNH